MRPSHISWTLIVAWVLFVGIYAATSLLLGPGGRLTTFGEFAQSIVPLFANAGLLLNAGSPNRRRNAFWMLLALGCTLWMAAQLLWTYSEVYRPRLAPLPFSASSLFFLHLVPMIAALALQPHERHPDRSLRFGYLDFSLLLLWWVYIYLFVLIPWQFVVPNTALYARNYDVLFLVGNLVFLAGLLLLARRAAGPWRSVYVQLFGAGFAFALGGYLTDKAMERGTYYTGSLYDLPLMASFAWFGTAGILAYQQRAGAEAESASSHEEEHELHQGRRTDGMWPARLAMVAVLSLPVLAMWSLASRAEPEAVRQFRLVVTLLASIPLTGLVFWRQHLVDSDRLRLLRASHESIENLRRLQTQFVQAEKLASLGQLAAGAAHEINNPLTAILGYSDLLIDDASEDERPRALATKIREQARRTKTLVTNLLCFARQVPAEKTLLDINTVVSSAVQLRGLDLRGKNIRIDLQTESVLPGVRGDPNQLLQIFFNIISNAVDAMEEVGGGVLTVRTLRERANVIIEFSDTGPGIKEPHLVFDPFYTTKPVGKGTGLGLSICYGLVQEHNGRISCYNRLEGGASFRVELPAVPALFPVSEPVGKSPSAETPPPAAAVKPRQD